VWENEFWNRSVSRVYELGVHLGGDMPETDVSVERRSGVVHDEQGRPIQERYVLSSARVALVGRPIAEDSSKQLVLYRVTPPVRTTTQIRGLYPGTYHPWSGPHLTWTRAACTGGALTVTLESDNALFHGLVQTVAVSGTTGAHTLRIPATTPGRTFVLRLVPKHGVCTVSFAITPARRPSVVLHTSDTRLLGLHFDEIHYSPPT